MEPAETRESLELKRFNADLGRKEAYKKARDIYQLTTKTNDPKEKEQIMELADEQLRICGEFTNIIWECDDKLGRLE